MAILQQCPICRKKQSLKNKICTCGESLDQAKRSQRVKYWITYRLSGGKQRWEAVGFSLQEAKSAEGKRRGQKHEGRIFDMLPGSKTTFNELTNWYLDLKSVKGLSSFVRLRLGIFNFNKVFGEKRVNDIKPIDLENYQEKRIEQGKAPATIDMEIALAKTMVNKAFDNDMADGKILKAFRSVRKRLRRGDNVRKRIIAIDEYLKLLEVSSPYLKAILIVAFNTGMRKGELRELRWSYIDREKGFIRLPANITKENRVKVIPINYQVKEVLGNLPRALKNDFVFLHKGEKIKSRENFRKTFLTACTKVGITYGIEKDSGIIFHDIRRSVKTYMLEAEIDKVYRDMILGHSLQGMDARYLSPSEESLKEAMEKYTKWLDLKLKNVYQNVNQKI